MIPVIIGGLVAGIAALKYALSDDDESSNSINEEIKRARRNQRARENRQRKTREKNEKREAIYQAVAQETMQYLDNFKSRLAGLVHIDTQICYFYEKSKGLKNATIDYSKVSSIKSQGANFLSEETETNFKRLEQIYGTCLIPDADLEKASEAIQEKHELMGNILGYKRQLFLLANKIGNTSSETTNSKKSHRSTN